MSLESLHSRHGPTTAGASELGFVDERPGIAGSVHRYGQDEEIYAAGDAVSDMFKILSGWVRTCHFLLDGRRQINAFYGPGDVFGLEAEPKYSLSAEAICDCQIVSYRHKPGRLDAEIALLAIQGMHRAQRHALMLGRRSATERVAAFLLEQAVPSPRQDIFLPMPRHDIADYLGLTTETVSRMLTQLDREKVISLGTARHVVIRSPRKLEALAIGELGFVA
jgi:CRP/FNR family nitrogen fixation transcriptional regulator